MEPVNPTPQTDSSLIHDWVSVVAHQVKTGLAANKWITKMFLDGDFGALSTEGHAFLEKSYSSNERLIGLINELLALERGMGDTISYTKKPFSCGALIDAVLFEFTGEAKAHHIDIITLPHPEHIPETIGDRAKIRFVFENMIENALKYSHDGGKIFVTLSHTDTHSTLSVRDTGIGITDKDLTHIGEKFYRGDTAREQNIPGTGLGVYIAREIIQNHNGTFSLQSTLGKGTEVTVTLPFTS
jgi:two-component system, OmpR family, sensor histidine kinase VicK